jgi:hypothetical protein
LNHPRGNHRCKPSYWKRKPSTRFHAPCTHFVAGTQRPDQPIPSCVAVLGRQVPTSQSPSKTQPELINSRDEYSKLANHLLRRRKISEKSPFNVEHAAINFPRKPLAEYPQEPLMRAILNSDGRGCVARSLNKSATERHRRRRFNALEGGGGRQWSEYQMLRTRGYLIEYSILCSLEAHAHPRQFGNDQSHPHANRKPGDVPTFISNQKDGGLKADQHPQKNRASCAQFDDVAPLLPINLW